MRREFSFHGRSTRSTSLLLRDACQRFHPSLRRLHPSWVSGWNGSAGVAGRRAKLQIHHRKCILVVQKERFCHLGSITYLRAPLLGETVAQTRACRSLLREDASTLRGVHVTWFLRHRMLLDLPAFADLRVPSNLFAARSRGRVCTYLGSVSKS